MKIFTAIMFLAAVEGAAMGQAGSAEVPLLTSDEFSAAVSFWRADIGEGQIAVRAGRIATLGTVSPRVFPYGSTTKSFTAVLVLRLAELGTLELDDRIGKFKFGIPGEEEITIRDLLAQTSGLPEYFYGVDPARTPRAGEIFSMIRSAARGARLSRGAFHYANTNYYLLGAICSKVTGQPLGELYKRYVCGPIGISALPTRVPTFDLNWYGGAGCLAGSIEDLTNFGGAVSTRDSRLLSRASWTDLMSPHVATTASGRDQYGYGLIVSQMSVYSVVSHGGEIPANAGEAPFVSMLIVRNGGLTPISFAAFGRKEWDAKSLNAVYGAFDSVCATVDAKTWISQFCGGLSAQEISNLVKSGALGAKLADLMSPKALGGLRERIGTLRTFVVRGEMVRGDSIALEGVASGSAGTAEVSAKFGLGGRLEGFGFK